MDTSRRRLRGPLPLGTAAHDTRGTRAVNGFRARVCRRGTRSIGFAAIILAVLCAAMPTAAAATGPAGAAPAANGTVPGCKTSVSLPKDEAPHSAPVEWWYFSGHLTGKDAKGHVHAYGYEYVIFQLLGIAPQPVYLGDLSITNLSHKTFQFAGQQDSYAVPKTKNSFALHTGSWTMSGGSGRDTLKAGMTGYSVNLGLRTTEPQSSRPTSAVTSRWQRHRSGRPITTHGHRWRPPARSWTTASR